MTSAKALLIVGIVTAPLFAAAAPLVAALGIPDVGDPAAPVGLPSQDDATCTIAGTAPRFVWTTCATRSDFTTGNLSVAGRANIADSLSASSMATRALDVSGPARVGSATVAGALSAASGAFSGAVQATDLRATNLQLDGRSEVGLLQLHLASSPACVEGVLALVRNADGSDTLEVCLRTAEGSLVWTPLAMGGYVASMTQPRLS